LDRISKTNFKRSVVQLQRAACHALEEAAKAQDLATASGSAANIEKAAQELRGVLPT
jgi:hypothetical protein